MVGALTAEVQPGAVFGRCVLRSLFGGGFQGGDLRVLLCFAHLIGCCLSFQTKGYIPRNI